MSENLHKEHRKRVKEEFLAHGFDENTPPHKILEMMLFFCVPQKDTNDMAHKLLNHYGSIARVLDAPVEELITFPGITRSNVVLFKMIMPIARIYNRDKSNTTGDFNSIEQIGNFLLSQYMGLCEEQLSILSLNANGKCLSFDFFEKGDIASVGVSTRKIIELCLKTGASCIVMAHNHPSGIALPSAADISITQTVAAAVKNISVPLLDHIIIANSDYVSLSQSQKYREIFLK